MSEVERTDREGVATLTLNRPESLNALSPQLFVELRAHV
ncbi:MAG: enoyl-CoA hydratase/isomerase family protein, partial [Deltaproteobacteria bacterium]|nr:enoyl-CoA hydratase/isomerase family protein [Deltaproteobacteria bacterium]